MESLLMALLQNYCSVGRWTNVNPLACGEVKDKSKAAACWHTWLVAPLRSLTTSAAALPLLWNRYSTIIAPGSYTTRPTCAALCSRKNWTSGVWTRTRWSRAAGWRTRRTGTRRRRCRFSTGSTSTRTNSPRRTSWSGSVWRTRTRTASSAVYRTSDRGSGHCLRNPTRRLLPRSVRSNSALNNCVLLFTH